DIAAICGFNPQPDPPASPDLAASMLFNINGGRGNDDIRVICGFNPQPDPPARGITVNTPVAGSVNGGCGNADIRVTYGFHPQPSPPAMPLLVVLPPPVTLNVNGGLGGHSIAARVGFNPQPDPPASPIAVNLLGGGGADSVRFDAVRRLDGALQLNALGGNDNDVIALNFMLDPASRGSVSSNVVSGGGNDAVNASFSSSLIGLQFNADLGGGNDMFAGQFLRAAPSGVAVGAPTFTM